MADERSEKKEKRKIREYPNASEYHIGSRKVTVCMDTDNDAVDLEFRILDGINVNHAAYKYSHGLSIAGIRLSTDAAMCLCSALKKQLNW